MAKKAVSYLKIVGLILTRYVTKISFTTNVYFES